MEISIRRCYSFNNDFSLNRIALSKAISKLDPSVDNIKIKSQSKIYRGYNSHKQYIFVQSLNDEPPEFLNPRFERNQWVLINSIDDKKLNKFLDDTDKK